MHMLRLRLADSSDAGIVLLNQAVLLAGVNDSVDAQAALCERLVDLRVMPYYLHQLDRVAGAAHFEVPVADGPTDHSPIARTIAGLRRSSLRRRNTWRRQQDDTRMSHISIYDTPAIDRLRAELKFDPRRLRALRTAFFKKSRGVDEALDELPADVRAEFAQSRRVPPADAGRGTRFATRRCHEARAANAGRLLDRISHHANRHRPRGAVPVVADWLRRGVRLLRDRPDGHRQKPLGRRDSRPGRARRRATCEPKIARFETSSSWAWASRFTTRKPSTKRSPPCSRPRCSIIRPAASSFPPSAFPMRWSAAHGVSQK